MDVDPDVQEFLEHFGVKGMRWGQRKAPSAVKLARKDARQITRLKTYGKGSRTRRNDVKARIASRSENDPAYKAAFEDKRKKLTTRKKGLKDPWNVTALALTGIYTASAIRLDMSTNPEKYIKVASFVGKSAGASMRTASKVAKGAKLLFENDMVVFSPGTFRPGSFVNAGARALGAG